MILKEKATINKNKGKNDNVIGARRLNLRLTSSQTTSEHRCSGSSLEATVDAYCLKEERELRFDGRDDVGSR
jgi:hypothetical protein